MVVVASIGNSGADGLYSAGAPGVGNNVIGTASYDNSHVGTRLTISPTIRRSAMPYLAGIAAADVGTDERHDAGAVVYAVTAPAAGDGCAARPAGNSAGQGRC